MTENMRSADQMVNILLRDPSRLDVIKTDPIAELAKLAQEAKDTVPIYVGDKSFYRIVVVSLGIVVVVAVIGGVILGLMGKTAPEMLLALGSAAVGALAGLLVPSPSAK